MTAILAIVGVQFAVAALLFGTLLLDRPTTDTPPAHPTLSWPFHLRRRHR